MFVTMFGIMVIGILRVVLVVFGVLFHLAVVTMLDLDSKLEAEICS